VTMFSLIGATAVSLLALAAPAMADDFGIHRGYHYYYHSGRVIDPPLPVRDALRWGYGTGCRSFHSGFGSLYGDGYYPGNVYAPCFVPY
jgi:hypothetical protein